MLVLTRREKQEIVFPNIDVRLTVIGIHGRQVKIGIDAPKEFEILRSEKLSENRVFQKLTPVNRHRIRNMLNTLKLQLHLLEIKCIEGTNSESSESLRRIIATLRDLDCQFADHDKPFNDPTGQPVAGESIEARSVLIVEDDDNERELLGGVLKLYGFEVDSVADGIEAVWYLERNPSPDVVLLDLGLPRCSGAETVHRIREDVRFCRLKVFAVSGDDPVDYLDRSTSGRFDGWFPKPLDPGRLVQALKQLQVSV